MCTIGVNGYNTFQFREPITVRKNILNIIILLKRTSLLTAVSLQVGLGLVWLQPLGKLRIDKITSALCLDFLEIRIVWANAGISGSYHLWSMLKELFWTKSRKSWFILLFKQPKWAKFEVINSFRVFIAWKLFYLYLHSYADLRICTNYNHFFAKGKSRFPAKMFIRMSAGRKY